MRKDNTWEPDMGRAVREGFMDEVSLKLKFLFFLLHFVACGILVPLQGWNLGHDSESYES